MLAMLPWLTLPECLPGSGCFLFKHPKQLHGRLPRSGCLPGTLQFICLIGLNLEMMGSGRLVMECEAGLGKRVGLIMERAV